METEFSVIKFETLFLSQDDARTHRKFYVRPVGPRYFTQDGRCAQCVIDREDDKIKIFWLVGDMLCQVLRHWANWEKLVGTDLGGENGGDWAICQDGDPLTIIYLRPAPMTAERRVVPTRDEISLILRKTDSSIRLYNMPCD